MSKPRIIFIAPLPPPVHGSAMVSKYIKDSKLINEEFDMDFVNLSTSRKMEEIGKTTPILFLKKLGRFVSAYISCLWLLLVNKYDLCYCAITCHGTGFLKDAPFVLLCKLFRKKIVIHQHNKGMSKCVDKWPYRWLLPLIYRNTKVILLSWYLYDDISKVVTRDQILICPNGILEILDAHKISKSDNAVPQLLFLSNLIPSKGVYMLLDACKILKEKGLQFICNFVGGETKEIDRTIFETAVKERCLDDVAYYHGPKYGEEKNRYLLESDVFVFPTFYFNECFPLVLLEAMQWGLPLVSSDEGGIPDIVQDGKNGFLCERNNPMSIADSIERLLIERDLREQMGVWGRQIFEENYTLEVFERNFAGVIRKCLE